MQGVGFEPTKPKQRCLRPSPLTTRESLLCVMTDTILSTVRKLYVYFLLLLVEKSTVGFEPTTLRLEVSRAIHCATWTLLTKKC